MTGHQLKFFKTFSEVINNNESGFHRKLNIANRTVPHRKISIRGRTLQYVMRLIVRPSPNLRWCCCLNCSFHEKVMVLNQNRFNCFNCYKIYSYNGSGRFSCHRDIASVFIRKQLCPIWLARDLNKDFTVVKRILVCRSTLKTLLLITNFE